MDVFNIYTDTIVFMALYMKRQFVPTGRVSLTKDQVDRYYGLVLQAIKEESGGRSPFAYRIIKGSPIVDTTSLGYQYVRAQQTTRLGYDRSKNEYYTDANEEDLLYTSFMNTPVALSECFTPVGYEKALGLDELANAKRR